MTTDKQRLRALAKAATAGDWVDASTPLGGIVRGGPVQQWVNGSGQDQIIMATGAQWMQPDEPRANAAFIAAASPASVLALLDEIAHLTKENARLREDRDGLLEDGAHLL